MGKHLHPSSNSDRIFIVHGRDGETKHEVARFLAALDLKPVILDEQASQGMTIIEKFEAHSNVGFSIVAKLWNLCHVLRDDGITYQEYVTELTYLLFLKMLAETGHEARLPKGYRWTDIAGRTGLDQLTHYKQALLDLGNPGLVKDLTVLAIFTDAQTKLRKPLSRWVYYALLKEDVQWRLVQDAREVARETLNLEQLRAIELLVPSIDEQAEIVRRTDAAFASLSKITTEHTRADHLLPKLDQAILAKAFLGELVPQDPNDEPASELLRQISTARPSSAATSSA